MEASIEKQRASVRLQVQAALPSEQSFFTVPWPMPSTPVPDAGPDCEPLPPDEISPLIEEVTQREGLTPDLLRAIIQKESAFRPCAVSRKGAQGLMQLMPDTARQFGVLDPFDPKQNLDAGVRFLKQLLIRYEGDLSLALGAYNAGPGRVDAFGGLPLLPETLEYVADIQEMLREK